MRSQFDDDGQGPDISDVLSEVSAAMTANLKKLGPILVLGVAVATAVMGFFKVGPGEKGVVRRFGAEHRLVEPGLAFALPFVEAYDVVNVEAVRRVEVGFRGDEARPDEALMLTGDENIVEVRMVVQYRVKNPSSYLFRIREPEQILHATAEVALRTIAGRTKLDAMMTTGRADVQSDVKKMLQKYMNDYESGLEITDVKLDRVDAPDEVKDAFVAVTRAREEKEKLVNQAMGYREDQVPRARGKSSKQVQAAEAYAQERVAFGKPLIAFPRVAAKLAMMAVEVMIARQLTYYAAAEKDAATLLESSEVAVDLAKIKASAEGLQSANNTKFFFAEGPEYMKSMLLTEA